MFDDHRQYIRRVLRAILENKDYVVEFKRICSDAAKSKNLYNPKEYLPYLSFLSDFTNLKVSDVAREADYQIALRDYFVRFGVYGSKVRGKKFHLPSAIGWLWLNHPKIAKNFISWLNKRTSSDPIVYREVWPSYAFRNTLDAKSYLKKKRSSDLDDASGSAASAALTLTNAAFNEEEDTNSSTDLIVDPDELIQDLLQSDSSKLVKLFTNFYPKAVNEGPFNIKHYSDRAQTYLEIIDVFRDPDKELSPEQSKLERMLPRTASFRKALYAGTGRLLSLEGILACHMQNGPWDREEIEEIHNLIRKSLSKEHPGIDENIFLNLTKTTKVRPDLVLRLKGNQPLFLQNSENFDFLMSYLDKLKQKDAFIPVKICLISFLLNSYAVGHYLSDEDLFKRSDAALSKLTQLDDPISKKYVTVFKKVLAHKDCFTPPHTTEVVARHEEIERAGVRPEFIYVATICFCQYFLHNMSQKIGDVKSVAEERWTDWAKDFALYDNILARGNLARPEIVKMLPEEVASFITNEVRDRIHSVNSEQGPSSEAVDLLRSKIS